MQLAFYTGKIHIVSSSSSITVIVAVVVNMVVIVAVLVVVLVTGFCSYSLLWRKLLLRMVTFGDHLAQLVYQCSINWLKIYIFKKKLNKNKTA